MERIETMVKNKCVYNCVNYAHADILDVVICCCCCSKMPPRKQSRTEGMEVALHHTSDFRQLSTVPGVGTNRKIIPLLCFGTTAADFARAMSIKDKIIVQVRLPEELKQESMHPMEMTDSSSKAVVLFDETKRTNAATGYGMVQFEVDIRQMDRDKKTACLIGDSLPVENGFVVVWFNKLLPAEQVDVTINCAARLVFVG